MDTECNSNLTCDRQGQSEGLQQKVATRDVKTSDNNLDYVTIIHFNDCYNIEPSSQSSGAAGFLTAINQYRDLNPMILFSGDIISPSFLSTFTKGEQMIPVLNDIGVHCAVFGNHEFDFGVENLIEFTKRTSFPWILSNVIDKETSNQLGDGQVFSIIERVGIKFGLIGLIEEDWLSSLATLDPSDVIYEDFVDRGRELAVMLKSDPHNVDYVIALTHFRKPNDILLADSVPEIDLILGGHDHDYGIFKRPNCTIIKSGTDFREFSLIKLKISPEYFKQKQLNPDSKQHSANQTTQTTSKPFVGQEIERIKCIGYEPDAQLSQKLDKFVTSIDEKMSQVLAQFNCDLDGRFASIRNYETNLGNFVTDIMLASTHADLAILNSGTLRSDRIHSRGAFTMRDLFNILGYIDPIAVLNASGEQVWRALENGVSQWPKLEGRFPQVSGCSFVFDPSKPPTKRINPKDIIIGDEQLDLKKQYKLTTKEYLASGKDGYDVFKECEILLGGDESPDLTTSILNHFEAINIIKSNRRTHHRQSVICVSRSSLQKMLSHQTSFVASESSLSPNIIDRNGSSNSADHLESRSQSNNTNDSGDFGHDDQLDGADHATYSINQSDSNNNNNSNSNLIINGTITLLRDTISEVTEECDEDDSASINSMSSSNGLVARYVAPTGLALPAGHQVASSPIVGTVAPEDLSNHQLSVDYDCSKNSPALSIVSPQLANLKPPNRQPKRLMSLDEVEYEQCKLEPKIEGRIRIVGVNA